jgi:lipoprotein-releasing system permease protein
MQFRFVLFIALRYFRTKRKKIAFSVFSVLGISVGVMTLIVVMAVMNGFQSSFIGPSLEVKSYHLQITPEDIAGLPEEVLDKISQIKGVSALTPFYELQGIAGLERPCIVRAIPFNAVERDTGFSLSFDNHYDRPDSASLRRPDTVVLGNQLAAQLQVRKGDILSLATISGSNLSLYAPVSRELAVTGIFKTGFYEIDLNWAFVSLETALRFDAGAKLVYGVKITDHFRDRQVISLINGIPEASLFSIESWREFNRVFFGALATEKKIMSLLIGLIFIVVGFNIFHSLRRSVNERLEEIATLKALGASSGIVKSIFVIEGLFIGLLGSFFGTLSGLLLSVHINAFFRLVENTANDIVFPCLEFALSPFIHDISFTPIYIFSPGVFYIEEVPTQIFFQEVFFIAFFALTIATLSSFWATRSIARAKPSVLLRYE